MTTFEAKYRQKQGGSQVSLPPSPAMTALREAANEDYRAFNAVAHPKRKLWVRTNGANPFAHVALPYSLLNHVIYDGSGFVISMHFSAPVICVTIQGRNLHELFHKLLDDEIDWVQEFDPRKWNTPREGEPYITGIEVNHAPSPAKRGSDSSATESKAIEKPARH